MVLFTFVFTWKRISFFFLKGVCMIKEVGERFLGKNSSKCLVVLILPRGIFGKPGEEELNSHWKTVVSCLPQRLEKAEECQF